MGRDSAYSPPDRHIRRHDTRAHPSTASRRRAVGADPVRCRPRRMRLVRLVLGDGYHEGADGSRARRARAPRRDGDPSAGRCDQLPGRPGALPLQRSSDRESRDLAARRRVEPDQSGVRNPGQERPAGDDWGAVGCPRSVLRDELRRTRRKGRADCPESGARPDGDRDRRCPMRRAPERRSAHRAAEAGVESRGGRRPRVRSVARETRGALASPPAPYGPRVRGPLRGAEPSAVSEGRRLVDQAMLPNLVIGPVRRFRRLPRLLFILGLASLLVGLARPQRVVGSTTQQSPTVVLAFDTSGSMAARDVSPSRLGEARRSRSAS